MNLPARIRAALHREWLRYAICVWLAGAFLPAAAAQSCGSQGVAVQVLGSGGPELQDKRASSSYVVWADGQAKALIDAGGGSALRLASSWGSLRSRRIMASSCAILTLCFIDFGSVACNPWDTINARSISDACLRLSPPQRSKTEALLSIA